MTKAILITGASSGIGEACARHAVEAEHNVALAARLLLLSDKEGESLWV